MSLQPSMRSLAARHFNWKGWERLIEENGFTIERPRQSRHPRFPEIVYPLDYGFIPHTLSTDGEAVDLFVGGARSGLVALIVTTDHRRGDREFKLIYNCTPEEIYLINGFINFDPVLMEGLLVMRRPMHELWDVR